MVFVQAAELPKGALVEFQVNLHTGRLTVEGTDKDQEEDDLDVVYSAGREPSMTWELSQADRPNHGSRATVFLEGECTQSSLVPTPRACSDPSAFTDGATLPDQVRRLLASRISVKAYHTLGVSPTWRQSTNPILFAIHADRGSTQSPLQAGSRRARHLDTSALGLISPCPLYSSARDLCLRRVYRPTRHAFLFVGEFRVKQ